MFRNRFYLRKLIAETICLAGLTVFSGCEKDPQPPTEEIITVESIGISSSPIMIGDTDILYVMIYPNNATDKTITLSSTNNNIITIQGSSTITAIDYGNYTYAKFPISAIAFGKVDIVASVGNKTDTATVQTFLPPSNNINGVVIRGLCWATRNIDMPGTFAESTIATGMLYQWNRKVGWSATDPLTNSNGETVTTWNTTVEEGSVWEIANDPSPDGWRIPSWEELKQLYDGGNAYATVNGVSGKIFFSEDGTVFLPGVPFIWQDGSVYPYGTYCQYMGENGGVLWFNSGDTLLTTFNEYSRYVPYALPIRCVKK